MYCPSYEPSLDLIDADGKEQSRSCCGPSLDGNDDDKDISVSFKEVSFKYQPEGNIDACPVAHATSCY
jgi:hypothetical protein